MVLEDFLVKLGFQVNKDQEAKLLGSIERVQKGLSMTALKAIGIAGAIDFSAYKAVQALTKEANTFTLLHASGAKVKALGVAFQRLGGDVAQATQSLSAFVTKAQMNPRGFEMLIRRLTRGSVSSYDKNGNGRDPVDVLMDVIRDKNFLSLRDNQKLQNLSLLGIDANTARYMLNRNFAPEYIKQLRIQQSIRSDKSDEYAQNIRKTWNELSNTGDILKTGFESLVGVITGNTGIINAIKRFNEALTGGLGWFVGAWESMIELSRDENGNFSWAKFVNNAMNPYATNEVQVADAFARGRKLDKQELSWWKDASAIKPKEIDYETEERLGKDSPEYKNLEKALRDQAVKERDERMKEFLARVERLRVKYGTSKEKVYAAIGIGDSADAAKKPANKPSEIKPFPKISIHDDDLSVGKQINVAEDVAEGVEDLARDRTIRELMDRLTSPDYMSGDKAGGRIANGSGNFSESDQFTKAKGFDRNNPGNIRGADGKFRVFATMEDGFRAMGEQLKAYQNAGAKSVRDMIGTYAPASDGNHTEAYIQRVSQALGVKPGDRVNLSDHKTLYKMMRTMADVELGAGAGNYFSGSVWERQAMLAAQSRRVSGAYSAHGGGRRGDLTQNVTVNINGDASRQVVGQMTSQLRDILVNRGLAKAHVL